MNKTITIDFYELEKYSKQIEYQRNTIENLNKQIYNLQQEIEFLKEGGDEILVIIKHENKPDYHEYKTKEKSIITDLIQENNNIRNKNEDLINKINNLENNIINMNIAIEQLKNLYEKEIFKYNNQIKEIENRNLLNRIFNKKINKIDDYLVLKPVEDKPKLIESKKPRGWHLMNEFVDSEGNVYFKGVLQPNLKGTR